MSEGISNASLFGLTDENSSRKGTDLWGKNQFNSTFPVALCLKMLDDGVKPVYVKVRKQGEETKFYAEDTRLAMSSVIGNPSTAYYEFEAPFSPYSSYIREENSLEKTDLVVHTQDKRGKKRSIRALEIKLTVVPDSSTVKLSEDDWAPEMVVRPVSSAYAVLSVYASLLKQGKPGLKKSLTEALASGYKKIRENDWESIAEISKNTEYLVEALREAVMLTSGIQSPFMVQPIWKTEGGSYDLAEKCFDVFVWSDVAVIALPLTKLRDSTEKADSKEKVSRSMRDVARHVRALYQLCTAGDMSYASIYRGMGLGNQSDKSFALSGQNTRHIMQHARLKKPHYSRSAVNEIILGGGENLLRPERRFDASLVISRLKEEIQQLSQKSF